MSTLTIELPSQAGQTAFNLRRWAELLDNEDLARIEGRVETDRHGRVIMSPPPAASHGGYQFEIAHMIRSWLPDGRVIVECPISTADGVRAADVAWASRESIRLLGKRNCFTRAPEICVEVLSPSNTPAEIAEKMSLYFDAGAKEVWQCDRSGKISFFADGHSKALRASALCPDFPKRVKLL
jgi:Uma2 family endonuclease